MFRIVEPPQVGRSDATVRVLRGRMIRIIVASRTSREVPVRIEDIEHIQIQTLSCGQFGDSIQLITLLGKYRLYV